jgi:hypothetical protein
MEDTNNGVPMLFQVNGRKGGTVSDGVKHRLSQNLCVRLVYSSDV